MRETKRPLVPTQHGKSAAVIVDVAKYEAHVDEVELVRDIREARAELERGEGIPHDEVIRELRSRISQAVTGVRSRTVPCGRPGS